MTLRRPAQTRAVVAIGKSIGAAGVALLMLVLSGWALGPSPTVREIDAKANGSQVTLIPGQAVRVKLDTNPATGYRWVIDRGAANVLQPVGQPLYTPSSTSVPLVGAGGTMTFDFVAAATGSDTLELAYRRSAEKTVAPARSFRVEVVVQ
jgi:inhibitor of cysteine peptidase